jgi:hypothetical protein
LLAVNWLLYAPLFFDPGPYRAGSKMAMCEPTVDRRAFSDR